MKGIKFTATNNVKAVLTKWDYLGFDNYLLACEAILTHPDWEERWDMSDCDSEDLKTLRTWREETFESNEQAELKQIAMLINQFALAANALTGAWIDMSGAGDVFADDYPFEHDFETINANITKWAVTAKNNVLK